MTVSQAESTNLFKTSHVVLLPASLPAVLPACSPPSSSRPNRNDNREALKEQVEKVRTGEADPKSLP